jgi:heme/copper-type cytochrome/quinol oxidase subunit 3
MAETGIDTALVPQRENAKLAVWAFLGGEVVFFGTLILVLILFRMREASAFADVRMLMSVPLVGLNTFILILSSYLVVRGLGAVRAGRARSLRLYLIGIFVLGAIFLGGQAIEWTTLFAEGLGVKSAFGTPFFTLTGIHGMHVLVGLVWLVYLIVHAFRGRFTPASHEGVEVFGLYWHFVDVVWIVLFTLFYLI